MEPLAEVNTTNITMTTADMKASRLENGSGFLHHEKTALSDLLNAKRGRGRPRKMKTKKHAEDSDDDSNGSGLYF